MEYMNTRDSQDLQIIHRVWCTVNVCPPVYFPVYSIDEGRAAIIWMVKQQFQQDEPTVNAYGLEVLVNGEWEEWHNEEGYDILGDIDLKGGWEWLLN